MLDLKAVESAPVIEAAYENNQVNPRFAGTWATVQIELGLKTKEDFDPKDFELPYDPKLDRLRDYLDQLERAKKPTAWELGLPIDRHVFDQDAPPDFKALVRSPKPDSSSTAPGFGSKVSPGKKPKGKKKKKR
ncbi:MAG: hypothetical protein HC812_12150 [Leptolyngbya sp. RL_3_1]|nr:hypothetical protein [Leptolyngbya sp. RL_3_1]